MLEFAILSMTDHVYFTKGTTVTHVIRWLNYKYGHQRFSHEDVIGEYPVPRNPTLQFKLDSAKILEKTVPFLVSPFIEDIEPEALKILQFLRKDHLDEITNIIEEALRTTFGFTMPSSILCKKHVLAKSRVASLNRQKYMEANCKKMHWLKALLNVVLDQHLAVFRPDLKFCMDDHAMVFMYYTKGTAASSSGDGATALMPMQPKKKARTGP